MKGAAASLEAYWAAGRRRRLGLDYTAPQDFVLFDQARRTTGCGSASSATGPFYCPPDQTIYIDVTFYDELRGRFGSSGGPLAEMYVVAHEWGHHMQNLAGILERAQDGQTGPTSNAVRVELQADCFAGRLGGERLGGARRERRAVPAADHRRADRRRARARPPRSATTASRRPRRAR